MGHFVEKCAICGVVINQCRCNACDKEVRLSVCVKCLTNSSASASAAPSFTVRSCGECPGLMKRSFCMASDGPDEIHNLAVIHPDCPMPKKGA